MKDENNNLLGLINRYKKITVAIIVVVILIACVYFIFEDETPSKSLFTTREAYNKIKSWKNSSDPNGDIYIKSIVGIHEIKNNGKAEGWDFYIDIKENNNLTAYFIRVKDKVNIIESRVINDNNYSKRYFNGLTFDSSDIFEIATDNNKIHNYLEKYDNAKIDGIYNRNSSNYNKTIWKIYWMAPGFGSPINAHIVINAHTGEVIEVESDV